MLVGAFVHLVQPSAADDADAAAAALLLLHHCRKMCGARSS
jgi:hypothetical protein